MKYKGYKGKAVYDDEARLFHGEVANLHAVITFQATSINKIEQAFKDSVNTYLEWCEKRRVNPEKPFSVNLPNN
jgi:predicted HicB family RNase H-like nuclease